MFWRPRGPWVLRFVLCLAAVLLPTLLDGTSESNKTITKRRGGSRNNTRRTGGLGTRRKEGGEEPVVVGETTVRWIGVFGKLLEVEKIPVLKDETVRRHIQQNARKYMGDRYYSVFSVDDEDGTAFKISRGDVLDYKLYGFRQPALEVVANAEIKLGDSTCLSAIRKEFILRNMFKFCVSQINTPSSRQSGKAPATPLSDRSSLWYYEINEDGQRREINATDFYRAGEVSSLSFQLRETANDAAKERNKSPEARAVVEPATSQRDDSSRSNSARGRETPKTKDRASRRTDRSDQSTEEESPRQRQRASGGHVKSIRPSPSFSKGHSVMFIDVLYQDGDGRSIELKRQKLPPSNELLSKFRPGLPELVPRQSTVQQTYLQYFARDPSGQMTYLDGAASVHDLRDKLRGKTLICMEYTGWMKVSLKYAVGHHPINKVIRYNNCEKVPVLLERFALMAPELNLSPQSYDVEYTLVEVTYLRNQSDDSDDSIDEQNGSKKTPTRANKMTIIENPEKVLLKGLLSGEGQMNILLTKKP